MSGGGIEALEHELRPARREPQGALVLLHGRGTNQFDLLPLLDELDPERRLVGVTPRAPLELSPGGWHWYISRAVGFPDADTFHSTYGTVARWLDALPEALGVPWSRTVLGGFSMGAVLSYALGLGARRPAPAAILALSGFLPTVEGFELDLSGREGFPVAIGHGTEDPVISVHFGRGCSTASRGCSTASIPSSFTCYTTGLPMSGRTPPRPTGGRDDGQACEHLDQVQVLATDERAPRASPGFGFRLSGRRRRARAPPIRYPTDPVLDRSVPILQESPSMSTGQSSTAKGISEQQDGQ